MVDDGRWTNIIIHWLKYTSEATEGLVPLRVLKMIFSLVLYKKVVIIRTRARPHAESDVINLIARVESFYSKTRVDKVLYVHVRSLMFTA